MEHCFDIAVWLTRFSGWPDWVEELPVAPWTLPHEVIQERLRARGVSYAFKVAVNPGYGPVRRFWHVKLSK